MRKYALRSVLSVVAAGLVAASLAAPAMAATQIIDATLLPSVSMTTSPTSNISWALAVGPNTKSAGNMAIQATTPYVVTVQSQKATLTEWDPAANNGAGGYVTGGNALTTPLMVTPTATGGTAALVGGPIAILTPSIGLGSANLVTGLGGTTDNFSLALDQAVLVSDKPTTGSRTYHNVLTYTASAAL